MSLTNPTIHVPHERVPVPSWIRDHLVWMLVGLAALAAVAVLAVSVVDSDSGTDLAPITQPFDPDRGSINAIEHRAAVGGVGVVVGGPTIADQGSINAIERRASDQGR